MRSCGQRCVREQHLDRLDLRTFYFILFMIPFGLKLIDKTMWLSLAKPKQTEGWEGICIGTY